MRALIIFLICIQSGWAQAPEVYKFGNLTVLFHEVEGYWINKSCVDDKCLALKRGKEYKGVRVPYELRKGGKNPTAVLCDQFMDGKVVKGVDPEGNEQSFCLFSDESYLNNSSI